MKKINYLVALIVFLGVSGCASMGSGTVAEKQAAILKMKDETLTTLFKQKPDTRAQLNAAPGYAVFSNANIKLFVVAAGTGYGVVKDTKTQRHTYMNMAEGGAGLGLGVKDYRLVIVFHTEKAMNDFVQKGWVFGGSADAAAKVSDKGASIEGEVNYGDVTVYTITESGLALQAMVKGNKFWVDEELN